MIEEALANSFWVVPLILALVQAVKITGFPNKYSPLVSLGIGVGLAFIVGESNTLSQTILSGVVYGLSASGLYSGVQATQKVALVKSGEVPLNQNNITDLTPQEIQEIKQKQMEKQQATQQQPQPQQPINRP
jgi:hypothetical protein